ncbi:hypothetical protein SYNPS1DRAFT_20757 [Syncephalis pseudoplumigaleata]|uniref:Tetratricopeptide repeat protein n=1 Tax=Syncephalis pseudoplumigaleata TaxID=1712513 RepID=A0A4P9Z5I0_9FUNG|nr:hypothetical protein SYNPS1DRAFT_20757 [Syncephalis pseudoplumigaleata]|eukprot:RKP27826.1 hypothetical protein SYNPS1DRAFT_20757 [Syncephalis pseudoplumigaleata]
MTLSKKAQLLANDIETCRIAGRWREIPELARRYLKHHPAGATLNHSVLAEYGIYSYLNTLDEVTVYADDGPGNISVTSAMPRSTFDELANHAQLAREHAHSQAEREEAAIISSVLYCFSAQYEEALQILTDIQWPPTNDVGDPIVLEGYRFILSLQAWIVKGIILEKVQNQPLDAYECYSNVWKLVRDYSGERGDTMIWWLEEALYRRPLIQMVHGTRTMAITAFRDYRDSCLGWPREFRPAKRLVLCRFSVPLISASYMEGDYVQGTPLLTSSGDAPMIQVPMTFRQEILQLHELYEDAVHRCAQFPRANHVNMLPLEMADQIMNDWKLIGAASRMERRGLVELLYRATEITFQAPAIMRHLVTALIALGEYEEAELALESYAELVGKRNAIVSRNDAMAAAQNEAVDGPAENGTLSSECQSSSVASTLNGSTSTAHDDAEHPQKVVETLLVGARLMMTDLAKPKDCIRHAQTAIKICEINNGVVNAQTYSTAWQLLGVGYGQLARECIQHDVRPGLYEQAISALTEAISRNPENAEAHYHLALQHADSRNLAQALVSVKQSLQHDSTRVRAWHLLALLMSANKDLEGALRVCQVGIETSEWEVQADGSGEKQGTAMDGEDVLALMATRVALEDALYGPEKSLAHMNSLFVLYGRVFAGDGGGSAASEINSTVRRDNDPNGSQAASRSDVPISSYAGSVSASNAGGARQAGTRALKALTELWLTSASAFRRLGRYEDARQAVEEAEGADSESSDVSCQAGLLLLDQSKVEEAMVAFAKAVYLEPQHVTGSVLLGRSNLLLGKYPLAEGLLRKTTRAMGWNCAEAWHYLGTVYQRTHRMDRAKECFWYALDLETTRPVRTFRILQP